MTVLRTIPPSRIINVVLTLCIVQIEFVQMALEVLGRSHVAREI